MHQLQIREIQNLYLLPRAAVTKFYKMGGSDNTNLLSQVWRVEAQVQDIGRVGPFWGL